MGRRNAAPFLYAALVLQGSPTSGPRPRRALLRLALAALAPLTLLVLLLAAAVGAVADEPGVDDDQDPFAAASAHEATQGFPLAANDVESVTPGPACSSSM